MEQWYTLQAKTNAEHLVALTLQRRGLQIYLPEIEVKKTSGGLKKVPFFPSYLFVKVDFSQASLSQIQWTPGLQRVVAFEDQPQPVAEEVIDLIRQKLGEKGTRSDRQPACEFRHGDTVRITKGPFQDLIGIFEGSPTASERVEVLLTILGASRVHLDVTDLEKVADAQATTRAHKPATKRPRRTRGRGRRVKQTTRLAA